MTDCPHVLLSIISFPPSFSLSLPPFILSLPLSFLLSLPLLLSFTFLLSLSYSLSLSLSDIPNERDIADGLLSILRSVTVTDVGASKEYPFPLGSLLGLVPLDIRSLLLPQLRKLPCRKKQAFLVYRTFELCKIRGLSQELKTSSVSARLNLASFHDFHRRLESLLQSPS